MYRWKIGDAYEGGWADDAIEGEGVYTYVHGGIYRGYQETMLTIFF